MEGGVWRLQTLWPLIHFRKSHVIICTILTSHYFMHVCMCVCVCACACACVCMCSCMCMCVCMCVCMCHVCSCVMHAYHMHVCISYACVHACVNVHVCICSYVCECVHVTLLSQLPVPMHLHSITVADAVPARFPTKHCTAPRMPPATCSVLASTVRFTVEGETRAPPKYQ